MRVIGITGSIGSGKSTLLRYLARQGFPTLSADQIVQELLRKNAPVQQRICQTLPQSCLEGVFSIPKLISLIESSPKALKTLENLLHPLVFSTFLRFTKTHQHHTKGLLFLEIPLLFETGCEVWLDGIIVTKTPAFLQEQRVLKRPGMTKQRYQLFTQRQMPAHKKEARSDYIIYTGLRRGFIASQAQAMLTYFYRLFYEREIFSPCGK